ncbi:MAG: cytochrome c nitrite reductase small subunit [Bdellovibrionota bacterium]
MRKFTALSRIRFLTILIPCLLLGVPLGTGLTTFIYADGISYLSPNPKVCINCHVMQSQFDSWLASSHHTVAKCNDCHSHGNVMQKYFQKSVNGFLHSAAFTTDYFNEPIRIKNFNLKITQKTCRSCHSSLIDSSRADHQSFSENNCLNCHKEVGHRKW